jgi:hypothetical protein
MTQDSSGLDHSKCLYPEDIAEAGDLVAESQAKYQDRHTDLDSNDGKSLGISSST